MTSATDTRDTVVHEIGERGRIHLRVADSRIRLRGVDGGTVRVAAEAGRDLSEAFTIELRPGELSLRSREHLLGLFLGFRRGLVLDVDVPREAAVVVETASGDVHATGLLGEQRFRTASGTIELVEAGGVTSVDAVSGDTSVDATAALSIDLRSVSGDLRVRAPLARFVAISTTSGDVELDADLAADGRHTIQTVSGDTTVRARGALRVETRTMTGSIQADVPHQVDERAGGRAIQVGVGGPSVSFRSLSGDLRVVASTSPARRAASAAPARSEAVDDRLAAARLDVLRSLERGEIDVATATERLTAIEEPTDG